MKWLTIDWALAASNPDTALHGLAVLCVALSYAGPPAFMTPPGNGRVARYAAGIDYHHLLEEKLNTLSETITALHANARVFVDTAPTMDKALAVRAGLGWQGRNTNILSSPSGFLHVPRWSRDGSPAHSRRAGQTGLRHMSSLRGRLSHRSAEGRLHH